MVDERSDAAARIERQIFLRTMAPGRAAATVVSTLAGSMEDVHLPPGRTLYQAGDAGELVHFVVSGTVELRAESGKTWRFGPRSILGMIDAMLERQVTRTAVAVTEVHALRLRAEDWFDLLEDNFEYARAIILTMSQNLHRERLQLGGGAEARESERKWPLREQAPLTIVERIIVLRHLRSFAGAGIQTLTSLAELAEEIRLEEGEELFRPGSFSDLCFVLARGAIELSREDPSARARYDAPALLGDVVAIGPGDEQYTARALEPSLVLRVREEDLFDVMELHFDLVRSVLKAMARERERLLEDAANGAAVESIAAPGTEAVQSGGRGPAG